MNDLNICVAANFMYMCYFGWPFADGPEQDKAKTMPHHHSSESWNPVVYVVYSSLPTAGWNDG